MQEYYPVYYDLNGNKIDKNNPPKCKYCMDQGYINMGGPDFEVNPCPFCNAYDERRKALFDE